MEMKVIRRRKNTENTENTENNKTNNKTNKTNVTNENTLNMDKTTGNTKIDNKIKTPTITITKELYDKMLADKTSLEKEIETLRASSIKRSKRIEELEEEFKNFKTQAKSKLIEIISSEPNDKYHVVVPRTLKTTKPELTEQQEKVRETLQVLANNFQEAHPDYQLEFRCGADTPIEDIKEEFEKADALASLSEMLTDNEEATNIKEAANVLYKSMGDLFRNVFENL